MNNWNRIYRISTQFQYFNNYMIYYPSFDILANYTIFDFEHISPSVQSYSFRQIRYRDSLKIFLTDNIMLKSQTSIKYYESGVLYWDSFSESPESSLLEQFFKILLIVNKNDSYRIGSGIRLYEFRKRNLNQPIASVSLGEFTQSSWGPRGID